MPPVAALEDEVEVVVDVDVVEDDEVVVDDEVMDEQRKYVGTIPSFTKLCDEQLMTNN